MQPLAYRIRPKSIDEVVGQSHLIGDGKLINNLINNKKIFSLILYGNPGVGKTTIATILANSLNIPYALFNGATDNKQRLNDLIHTAEISNEYIIIIDEIHRLKKDIQDVLLPYLEKGTFSIIGMTTTNPYISVNPAIRSRCHVLELKPLTKEDILLKLKQISKNEDVISHDTLIDDEVLEHISSLSNGDLRNALNLFELLLLSNNKKHLSAEDFKNLNPQLSLLIDQNSDGHYDTLSAFQKSIRGSDVNAALHYLARLIHAGDLESILRRLAVIAFEDIGLANPNACVHTMAAIDAARHVGLPEARIPLGNAVIDLALSPKSRSGHIALDKALEDIEKGLIGDIPEFIKYKPLNPPFKYNPDEKNKYKYNYLPENLSHVIYYTPKEYPNTYEYQLIQNYKLINKQKKR